jgi:hypothetical protein
MPEHVELGLEGELNGGDIDQDYLGLLKKLDIPL